MYNRYVPPEYLYTPVCGCEPSRTQAHSDKEKYIREGDAVQGEHTNSNTFFRNFIGAEGDKWKKLGAFLENTKIAGFKNLFSPFGLENIDTGDILLFLIILFLLSEGDELEMAITLGLMLLLSAGEEKKCPKEDSDLR